MTPHAHQFYIGGKWIDPIGSEQMEVVDPSSEEPLMTVALGSGADVDRAVRAARAAFPGFAATDRTERSGLAAHVQSANVARARRVASRMRAGQVFINYPVWDPGAPFGYKQSGNGREYAQYGLEDYLESRAILGYAAA